MDRKEKAVSRWKEAKKKGEIDSKITEFVELLNDTESYYTTSSCSGRIVVCQTDENDKESFKFLGKWHRKVDLDEIRDSLVSDNKGKTWIKMEPFIFHICSDTVQDASRIVRTAKSIGLKSSGIFQTRKRVMFQIIGEEWLSTPVGQQGEIFIDEGMLELVVNEANQKLENNFERLEVLQEDIREILS